MQELLDQAIERTAALVEAVPTERYDTPTGNEGWDVRQLVNHLVAGNLMFAKTARGEQADMAVFEQDHLAGAGDAAALYRTTAAEATEAWRRPGVLEETTPFGMPGNLVFGMYLMEALLHGWDLAKATDQDAALPVDACETALELARQLPPEQTRGGSVWGPEVEISADAPADQRLAAFTGRQP